MCQKGNAVMRAGSLRVRRGLAALDEDFAETKLVGFVEPGGLLRPER